MTRHYKYIEKFPVRVIESPLIALDFETTGLNPRTDSIVGAAFSVGQETGYYTPDWKGVVQSIAQSNCNVICHNAVFDYGWIIHHGYKFKTIVHDTMLLADVLDLDRDNLGLKDLAKTHLGEQAVCKDQAMDDWLQSQHLSKAHLSKAPKNLLTEYAAEDAINTYELFQLFVKKAREVDAYLSRQNIPGSVLDYYLSEQVPLIPVVIAMQRKGVKLNIETLVQRKAELEQRQKVLSEELTELNRPYLEIIEGLLIEKVIEKRKKLNKTGKIKKLPPRVPFNWGSNDHLKLLFLTVLKIPVTKKTKKGNDSVDNSFFETLVPKFPWVNKLLELKELHKLTSTYLSGLLTQQEGGLIHANFHLTGTETGRFSCSGPNLQNLPKHGNIKQLFIPRDGHKFLYVDYSQVELRIAAHLSQDEILLKAYQEGLDLHQTTADLIKSERQHGKTINFAIIYKASGWRVAEIMGWMDGIPLCVNPDKGFKCKCDGCSKRRDAARRGDEIIEILFGKYTGLKNYIDKQLDFMLKYRISISQFGRLRRLRELNSEDRKQHNHAIKAGFNLPVQSFGASLCKRAMVQLYNAGYTIVNQIHDSIYLEVPIEQLEVAQREVKQIMETIYPLQVPLLAEPKILNSFEEKEAA